MSLFVGEWARLESNPATPWFSMYKGPLGAIGRNPAPKDRVRLHWPYHPWQKLPRLYIVYLRIRTVYCT